MKDMIKLLDPNLKYERHAILGEKIRIWVTVWLKARSTSSSSSSVSCTAVVLSLPSKTKSCLSKIQLFSTNPAKNRAKAFTFGIKSWKAAPQD